MNLMIAFPNIMLILLSALINWSENECGACPCTLKFHKSGCIVGMAFVTKKLAFGLKYNQKVCV